MNTHESGSPELFQQKLERVFELHEKGIHTEAEQLYVELIEHSPSIWQLHFNFGLLLFELERFDEAGAAYRRGLSVDEANPDLWFNLAICCKAMGAYEDALNAYLKVLSLSPDDIDCLYNIAGCYRTMDEDEAAINWYRKTLQIDPTHLSAVTNLAYLYHKNDQQHEAALLYQKILDLDPSHERADYMLAAVRGKSRQRAPDGYVRDLFDQFSDHYDENLVEKLGYRLPSLLLRFMQRMGNNRSSFGNLLDLGCGTGLAGETLAPYCTSMTGVDISEKMIDAAHAKSIYASLHVSELRAFLDQAEAHSYDCTIAADVFPYIGDLRELFMLLANATVDEGRFCFSIENLPDGESPFTLQPSGRFAHTATYIETLASETGWHLVAQEDTTLRREKDDWISGVIFGLTIPSGRRQTT